MKEPNGIFYLHNSSNTNMPGTDCINQAQKRQWNRCPFYHYPYASQLIISNKLLYIILISLDDDSLTYIFTLYIYTTKKRLPDSFFPDRNTLGPIKHGLRFPNQASSAQLNLQFGAKLGLV